MNPTSVAVPILLTYHTDSISAVKPIKSHRNGKPKTRKKTGEINEFRVPHIAANIAIAAKSRDPKNVTFNHFAIVTRFHKIITCKTYKPFLNKQSMVRHYESFREGVTRFSVSLPPALVKDFDEVWKDVGYDNRSRATHDALRNFLSEYKRAHAEDEEIAGAIVLHACMRKPYGVTPQPTLRGIPRIETSFSEAGLPKA
jgi:hypothetical protein